MMIDFLSINNKDRKFFSFKKTFLLADISIDIIFEMLYFNIQINFSNRELKLRLYTTEKAFLTTSQVELVEKNEFAAVAVDLENEIFKVYIVFIASLYPV